jgi:tRNA pseudouridine55 synthase
LTPPDSGILLLDKPQGFSSNSALGRAKRVLGIRKAGHTGTLDPLASGLLVLCFGEATKVAGFLLDGDKTYIAEIRLGLTTETDDAEGEAIAERPVPALDSKTLESVLDAFRGPVEQVPPMYSALKQNGERLYKLARRGETVERPARAVTIRELTMLEHDQDRLVVQVCCSKGTYIRSLARDLGEQLGCGAHLSALRRTQSAPYRLSDAVTLEELESMDVDLARGRLKSPDSALGHLPAIELQDEESKRLQMGQRLSPQRLGDVSGLVRLYGPHGFFGLGEAEPRGLKPRRLFNASRG